MSVFDLSGGSLALPDVASLDDIAEKLSRDGYVLCPGFFPIQVARDLLNEAQASWQEGAFRQGAVGRGPTQAFRSEIRTDHICWLDPADPTPAQLAYWNSMEALRETLNRTLFLGLFELEAHLARFAPGGFYKPHLDRQKQTWARVLSAVVYLDEDWQADDGGQLRLYTDRVANVDGPHLDVFPEPGKLALFLSEEIWHEVRLARKPRHTLTGWFRCRSEHGG